MNDIPFFLQADANKKDDDGGWGSWFAPPKLLSSVTSFTTNQITQILSTVENGLNIPEPEDLAREELLLDGIYNLVNTCYSAYFIY